MSSKVSVLNRQDRVSVDRRKIGAAARRILKTLGYEGYELTVVLADDREVTRLNRQYFRRNRSTNVISFPMMDGSPLSLRARMLGEVVISAETAERDAEEAGKKGEEEILFLLIHGILHLAGYDHEGTKGERLHMETKEREIFSLLKHPPSRKSSGR
ncbi:MAG: rRNA maturation RNase YbeY [Deltaproteobacteria bacterium]|nr:rRNA maturation RNase YbeY [Deltaproteobacteria bacterium]